MGNEPVKEKICLKNETLSVFKKLVCEVTYWYGQDIHNRSVNFTTMCRTIQWTLSQCWRDPQLTFYNLMAVPGFVYRIEACWNTRLKSYSMSRSKVSETSKGVQPTRLFMTQISEKRSKCFQSIIIWGNTDENGWIMLSTTVFFSVQTKRQKMRRTSENEVKGEIITGDLGPFL